MSGDGSNMGLTAGRAMRAVLGGAQPTDKDRQTVEELATRIRQAPLPLEGEPPFEREGDGYSIAADSIAHAFLVLADEDPSVLEPAGVYTDDDLKHADEHTREVLLGVSKDPASGAWDAMSERWPGADDWLGGASGFMVGFAFNTARVVKGLAPGPNGAIIEIGKS
jgi:hypothetical protein